MFKSLIISIWAIGVTIAVVFAPQFLGGETSVDGANKPSLVDHRSDTLSAALFDHGSVIGHFTTRVRYKLPKSAVDPDSVPVDQIILDGLFELVYDADPRELAKLRERQLAEMAERLAMSLNSRSTPFPISDVRFDSARLMLKTDSP